MKRQEELATAISTSSVTPLGDSVSIEARHEASATPSAL